MTLFDFVIAAIVGVSALVGLGRGAMREMTNVAAFVLAVFVAVFGLRFSGPIAAHSIHPGWAANIVAIGGVFLVAYIILRIIGGAMTGSVRHSPEVGGVDRILGLGFGLVRGLVLVGLVVMVLGTAFGDHLPHGIADAKLFPVAEASATALKAIGPRISPFANHAADKAGPGATAEALSGAPPSGGGQNSDSGYSAAARKGLDEAVEKSR
jgi:membrane protein required for colicin V production